MIKKYLIEIKNRSVLLFLTYFFTIFTSYYYKEILLFLIIKFTYKKNYLLYFIFTDVTEIFSVYIKLFFFLSFQTTLLLTIYHFFIFFIPAFIKVEYIFIKLTIKKIILIWFISLLIIHYSFIPLSWNFFLSFQNLIFTNSFNIHFEAKLNEFFSFYTSLYYACVLYFQAIVLLFFVLKYLNTNFINVRKFRKLYYFSLIFFSTLFCPDPITQILLSFFLIIIYEIWLFLFLFALLK